MTSLNVRWVGLIAIAVMLLLLFYQTTSEPDGEQSRLVLPGLKAQLMDVSRLSIHPSTEGAEVVTIEKSNGQWRVPEQFGYAADVVTLSKLLNQLADLRIAEIKTARPDNHGRLGVASEGDGAGTLVKVDAQRTFEIVIGNSLDSRGSFVRQLGSDQVYLAEGVLDTPVDSLDMIDPVVINIDAADIQAIEINSASSTLAAERDLETGKVTVRNLPEGAELKYEGVADSLARLLVNVRMTDVRPYEAEVFTDASMATITTTEGRVIEARTVEAGDEFWLHLESEGNEAWQYRVSEYNFNQLNKSLVDLVKSEDGQPE